MFVRESNEHVKGDFCVSAKYDENAIPIPEQVVFGKVVEGLRHHKGLTQTDLAGAAGISNAALSRLERGESNPSLGTILSLARGLDLPPHRLMEAYDLAMTGATERLEAVTSGGELSKAAVAAGLAGLAAGAAGGAVGRAALRGLAAVGGAAVAGPAGALVGMAVASAIGAGVFGALATFVTAKDEEEGARKQRT
jgi:transcriptional regulator with XRE-family HTH domain